MITVLEKPTKADQKFAKETIIELEKISEKKKSAYHVYLSFQSKGKEESLEVPGYVIRYLKFLLGNMAEGKALQISPVEAELSTQEAADMLGVSRPFLVKLLEQGKIPFKKVGTHRRIDLKDLQAYERKQKAIREKNLNFLAGQAQDLNLGYEL
jgi:excisionase family DNA binding protein